MADGDNTTIPADIYSLPTGPATWDALGIFYVTFCATWTMLVLLGMVFLWLHRQMQILRVRGLPLLFASILVLHIYWILGQIVYPIGQTVPPITALDVKYFCMGIWFPLGIALFQASNTRFLLVATMETQFARPYGPTGTRKESRGGRSWVSRVKNLEYSDRLLVYVGLGMIVQVVLTVAMWLLVRKYHPTFGLPGTDVRGTIEQQLVQLSRGWEWWPTALWQSVWTWILAPILLWRSWEIRNTLGWRAQTIGCFISSLHATPLFLLSMYLDAFAPVNKYFEPSQWILLSVLMFEVFTIFVPCAHVFWLLNVRPQVVRRNTTWGSASAASESPHKNSMLRPTISPETTDCISFSQIESAVRMDDLPDWIWTMGALEEVLDIDPLPLQDFSARSDFSGENIAFLSRITKWKRAWPQDGGDGTRMHDAYNAALAIYTDFISIHDAQYPVNLTSKELEPLRDFFEKQARLVYGAPRFNPITPFMDYGGLPPIPESGDVILGATRVGSICPTNEMLNRARYEGEIPTGFSKSTFDAAQTQVKYLVFTNTWPKFVLESRVAQSTKAFRRSDVSNSTRQTKCFAE